MQIIKDEQSDAAKAARQQPFHMKPDRLAQLVAAIPRTPVKDETAD